MVEKASGASAESALNIRAVERACDICDLLREVPDGMSLADIVERTGLPKSTAYRYLITLAGRQYVEFVGRDERSQVARLGRAFRPTPEHGSERFLQFARAELAPLRDVTDETVNIGLLDGARYVHALVIESEQIIRLAARVGERAPLHCTAIGKVIAVQLPVERLKSLLAAEGMPKLTPRTIVSLDAYLREIERVRARGYAVDDCESQQDGRCVAVALRGFDVASGLSISAPARRLPKKRIPEFAALLSQWADRLVDQYRAT